MDLDITLGALSDERLLIVTGLQEGNPEPLAKHLDAGGELYADLREALVKYLRGEYPRKRGRVRTYAQHVRERDVRWKVLNLQNLIALRDGSRGSFQKALDAYRDRGYLPRVEEETLRKWVGRGLSKDQLKVIDEVRAEATTDGPPTGSGN